MNFDLRRWQILDYVVLGLFVLLVVGVSLAWWSPDARGAFEAGLEGSGVTIDDLEGMNLDVGGLLDEALAGAGAAGYDTGLDVTELDSVAFILVFAILAALLVLAKPLFSMDRPLPKWYMQSLAIMVIGGIMLIITFFRLVVAPDGGHDSWKPGAGGFITLVGSLAVLGVGYLMFRDKTGAYGSATLPKMPKINVVTSGSAPTSPGASPAGGYAPPAAPAAPPVAGSKFCSGCGTPLAPGATFCTKCGKQA